jgi:hypothetical protein
MWARVMNQHQIGAFLSTRLDISRVTGGLSRLGPCEGTRAVRETDRYSFQNDWTQKRGNHGR